MKIRQINVLKRRKFGRNLRSTTSRLARPLRTVFLARGIFIVPWYVRSSLVWSPKWNHWHVESIPFWSFRCRSPGYYCTFCSFLSLHFCALARHTASSIDFPFLAQIFHLGATRRFKKVLHVLLCAAGLVWRSWFFTSMVFGDLKIFCSTICAQQVSLVTEMESLACRKHPLLVISVQVTGVLLHFLFIFEFAFLCFSAAYCVVDWFPLFGADFSPGCYAAI